MNEKLKLYLNILAEHITNDDTLYRDLVVSGYALGVTDEMLMEHTGITKSEISTCRQSEGRIGWEYKEKIVKATIEILAEAPESRLEAMERRLSALETQAHEPGGFGRSGKVRRSRIEQREEGALKE